MMGLRNIIDGDSDTQLSEQIYAQRVAISLRDGENMKIWPENRRKGLYEPINAIFRPIFRFSALTDAKTAKK